MPELELSMDIVCKVIDKAREFHSKEAVVIPENINETSEEDLLQVLADHENDLTYTEVKTEINLLEPDQQMTLVAIMYLGRGDFSLDEWSLCMDEAKVGWTTHTAEYLLSKPMIADYLEEGISQLGFSCQD